MIEGTWPVVACCWKGIFGAHVIVKLLSTSAVVATSSHVISLGAFSIDLEDIFPEIHQPLIPEGPHKDTTQPRNRWRIARTAGLARFNGDGLMDRVWEDYFLGIFLVKNAKLVKFCGLLSPVLACFLAWHRVCWWSFFYPCEMSVGGSELVFDFDD